MAESHGRILVTGGAGFIGSHYTQWVLEHTAHEVLVYDALTYAGNPANLAELDGHSRFEFVHADICDAGAVDAAMQTCTAVVHFAAETHVDRSISGGDRFVRTNCVGTNVLCESATAHGIERFVHVSTDEVYGSVAEGSSTEDDPLRPSSPYAASKAGSDLIALSHHATHGLPVVVTRSSNNYGPRQYPEKLIPLFVTNLMDGLQVPLYGDGENVRDWCHVEDNCAAIHAALDHGSSGEIYNIAADNPLTNARLADMLLALCGRDVSFVEQVKDRLGHDRRYSVDTAKIRGLGWAPRWSLTDGLAQTVDWYRQNRSWWEHIGDARA